MSKWTSAKSWSTGDLRFDESDKTSETLASARKLVCVVTFVSDRRDRSDTDDFFLNSFSNNHMNDRESLRCQMIVQLKFLLLQWDSSITVIIRRLDYDVRLTNDTLKSRNNEKDWSWLRESI